MRSLLILIISLIPLYFGIKLTGKKLKEGIFNYGNLIAVSFYILFGLYFSMTKYSISFTGFLTNLSICIFSISIFSLIVAIKKKNNRLQNFSIASIIIFIILFSIFRNNQIPSFENTFNSMVFTMLFSTVGFSLGMISPSLTGFYFFNFLFAALNHNPITLEMTKFLDLFEIKSFIASKLFSTVLFISSLISTTSDTVDIVNTNHY